MLVFHYRKPELETRKQGERARMLEDSLKGISEDAHMGWNVNIWTCTGYPDLSLGLARGTGSSDRKSITENSGHTENTWHMGRECVPKQHTMSTQATGSCSWQRQHRYVCTRINPLLKAHQKGAACVCGGVCTWKGVCVCVLCV